MVSATQRLNILLNLKKFAQIWAKRVVVPGWTKEKLIALAMQRKLYKTKTAASKVSNVTLAEQLGIDIKTGGEKQTSKPKPDPTSTPNPEPKKEEKTDISQLDLDKELAQKGGFRKMQALFKAAGLKPGTSKQTLINAYEKWKEKNGVKKEEKKEEQEIIKNKKKTSFKTPQWNPTKKTPDTSTQTNEKQEKEYLDALSKKNKISEGLLDDLMKQAKAPPPSRAEVASLRLYTANDFSLINKHLRGIDVPESRIKQNEILKTIEMATTALKTAPKKLRHTGSVYRGSLLPQSVIDQYQEDSVIEEKAFISTSKRPSMAGNFTQGLFPDPDKREVVFTIQSKNGVDVSKISRYEEEEEILFPPKTKFKVLKKEVDKDGVTRIYLDEQ